MRMCTDPWIRLPSVENATPSMGILQGPRATCTVVHVSIYVMQDDQGCVIIVLRTLLSSLTQGKGQVFKE